MKAQGTKKNYSATNLLKAVESFKSGKCTLREASIKFGVPRTTIQNNASTSKDDILSRQKKKKKVVQKIKKNYSKENLLQAVECFKSGSFTLKGASLRFGVPKTTIQNYANQKQFTEEEISLAVDAINRGSYSLIQAAQDFKIPTAVLKKRILSHNREIDLNTDDDENEMYFPDDVTKTEIIFTPEVQKCRICLEILTDFFISLNEVSESLVVEDEEQKPKKYYEIYQYVIAATNDEYLQNGPQNVCMNCSDDLIEAYKFKRKCEKNEIIFDIQNMQIKQEQDEEEEVKGDEIVLAMDLDFVNKSEEKNQDESNDLDTVEISNIKDEQTNGIQSYCPFCDYTSDKCDARIKTHIRQKHKDKILNCPREGCTFVYYLEKQLEFHLEEKHNKTIVKTPAERSYTCYICGLMCGSAKRLYNHLATHKPKTICVYCGSAVKEIEIHMRITHKIGCKEYFCADCDYKTPSRPLLSHHVEIHKKFKDLICQICNAAFKTRKSVRDHQRVHKEKKYECPVCLSLFLTNKQLRQHVERHHEFYQLPPKGTVMAKKLN